ncbi:related to PLB1-phospholipase B (lysophospholipase) [Phialocephala subalpina]|uniref:Lysophospholipase n=1 Tax=Phialocephala subalpina TaxID=576137 RepID=A0A1L7XWX6_9HELO|nr:related to PLB1-phospholipase B (lysophospholipase) [Phialocephala subalpina]
MFPSLFLATLISGAVATSSFAPTTATCPSSLVRIATSLSTDEETWRTARKTLADTSLRSWLSDKGFETTAELPTLGLSISGGGYRALLTGAGVIQALDSDDSDVSTSGLYQAITYTSALSGGSWLLSSLADHDFPTVSSLLSSQWESAFSNGILAPNGWLALIAYAEILIDINAKESAGFTSTFTDLWARLLGYQLLSGSDGGVASTLSGIQSKSKFASHSIPYPIITSLNADLTTGSCVPEANSSVWELTPFEFGSWADEVNAFTPSKYLGSSVSNGAGSTCYTGYDNLGFVLGTSSNVFNDLAAIYSSLASTINTLCSATIGTVDDSTLGDVISALETVFPSLTADLASALDALYALYPNPFYNLASASQVSSQETLHMVDGGESGQTSPIFPHLLPARNVSLVIVNDNNGDGSVMPSYPNGTAIYKSYLAAKAAGLTRMPAVPSPISYLTNYTSGNPIFFGCKDSSVTTLVWLPNADYTYASGIATFELTFTSTVSKEMVANGAAVMSRNDSDEWAVCLSCAILDAGGLDVPSSCDACFEQYCYAG